MIGLHQDPLIQQQFKKKRQLHPLSMPSASVIRGHAHGNEHGESKVPETNNHSATSSDVIRVETNDVCTFAKEDKDKSSHSHINVVKSTQSNVAKCASGNDRQHTKTKFVANRHQQHRSNKNSTKIKFNNTGNWWRPLLRDMITAFLPIFVLYKISTHPFVSNVGYRDPNAPEKYSPRERFEQILFRLAIKKKQEELQRDRLFLEAMNEGKCMDFPTIEMPTQMKQQRNRPRRKFKGKTKPRRQTTATGMVKGRKMNRSKARRAHASTPSSAPWSSRLASAVWGDHHSDSANNVHKGTEASKRDSHVKKQEGGKKGSNRKTRKKKFG